MNAELTCKELVELVTEYLEGALTPTDVVRFERHISACPGCDTYVEQYRETIRLTGMLREDDLEPSVRDALLEQFRDWKQTPS